MSEHDPRRMPPFLIKQVAQDLVSRGEARLRPYGFGFSSLPILVALKKGEAATQADLARLLGVAQPSMAQTLARLERDGLITRSPDPAHRRNQIIRLTEAALGRLPQARRLLGEDNAQAMAGFTEDEAALFSGFLEKMKANLRRAPGR